MIAFTITWILLFAGLGLLAYRLVSPSSTNTQNINNYIGKSAYELAIENGFVGSKEDYLKSLQGANGVGQKGEKGDRGVKGEKGDNGNNGLNGQNGITEVKNTETKIVIEKQSEIPGPKGDNGAQGIPGIDAKQLILGIDSETGKLKQSYVGEDDWFEIPVLCGQVICKEARK